MLDAQEFERWQHCGSEAVQRLSRHYIPSRYPDAYPAGTPGTHYGRQDADEAIADATRVLAMVRDAWKQLVIATDESGTVEEAE